MTEGRFSHNSWMPFHSVCFHLAQTLIPTQPETTNKRQCRLIVSLPPFCFCFFIFLSDRFRETARYTRGLRDGAGKSPRASAVKEDEFNDIPQNAAF